MNGKSETALRHESTLLIRPEFLNHGGTVFGGYMMQWADDMAYNAASLAYPHANFVTRLFGQFDFKSPARVGDIIKVISCGIDVDNAVGRADHAGAGLGRERLIRNDRQRVTGREDRRIGRVAPRSKGRRNRHARRCRAADT